MSRNVVAERAEIDHVVAGKTVCHLFAERVASGPSADALSWSDGGRWRSLSWIAYRDGVRDLSLALRTMGFGRDRFGLILARNVHEHLVADLAITHAGGAAISVYNTLAPEQIEYLANHSQATIAFVAIGCRSSPVWC